MMSRDKLQAIEGELNEHKAGVQSKINELHATYIDSIKGDNLLVYWEDMYNLSGQKRGFDIALSIIRNERNVT